MIAAEHPGRAGLRVPGIFASDGASPGVSAKEKIPRIRCGRGIGERKRNFGQRRIVCSCPHRCRVVSCIWLPVGIAAPVYFPDLFRRFSSGYSATIFRNSRICCCCSGEGGFSRYFSFSSASLFGEIHSIEIPSSISSSCANFFISILHCVGFSIRTVFKVVKRFRLRFASHSRVHRISVCTPSFRWYGQAVLGPCRLRRRLTPPRFPRWHEEGRPQG